MSTPQGPDRYGADPDHSGPPTWGTPPPGGWGHPDAGPPTGAWDPALDDRDDQDGRGAAAGDTAYVGRRRAEDREPAAPLPWGDQAGGPERRPDDGYDDTRYADDPYAGTRYDDTRYDDGGHPDPRYADPRYTDGDRYPDERYADDRGYDATAYDRLPPQQPGPGDGPWSDGGPGERFTPGDEPWAPREEVRGPRRGPGGLGRGALIGIVAGVLVVAALAVALFVTPGWAVTRTLDKTALQNGVTQILTQNYRLQVGAVECPDDVAVEAGTGFACQALVDGEPVTVSGTVTSDDGDYQVARV